MCFYQWLIVGWISQNIILYHTYPHILFWNLYFTAGIHAGMHVHITIMNLCLREYTCIYTCSYVLTLIIKSIFPPADRKFFLQWVFLSLSLLPRLYSSLFSEEETILTESRHRRIVPTQGVPITAMKYSLVSTNCDFQMLHCPTSCSFHCYRKL